MSELTYMQIREGKRKREDLYLPILHFPVADPFAASNWIDVLGEKAFCGWLKFHTLVDRSFTTTTPGAVAYKVPRSIESLSTLLKMSKSTLYRAILKPLWNHGLIDLIEWKEQVKLGQKSINVLVYPYPQNDKSLENQPLTKVRNYETDYNSSARIFALQGGRPKKSSYKEADIANRFNNETVGEFKVYGLNVNLINRFKTKTVTVSKVKPINITNSRINISKSNKVIDTVESLDVSPTGDENQNEDNVSQAMIESLSQQLKKQKDKPIDLDRALIESLTLEEGTPARLIKYFASYFNTYEEVNKVLTTLYSANKQASKLYSSEIGMPIFLGYDDALEQEYINVFLNCIRRVKNSSLKPIGDFYSYFYSSVLECSKNIYTARISDSNDNDPNHLSEEDFYKLVEEKMNRS